MIEYNTFAIAALIYHMQQIFSQNHTNKSYNMIKLLDHIYCMQDVVRKWPVNEDDLPCILLMFGRFYVCGRSVNGMSYIFIFKTPKTNKNNL